MPMFMLRDLNRIYICYKLTSVDLLKLIYMVNPKDFCVPATHIHAHSLTHTHTQAKAWILYKYIWIHTNTHTHYVFMLLILFTDNKIHGG